MRKLIYFSLTDLARKSYLETQATSHQHQSPAWDQQHSREAPMSQQNTFLFPFPAKYFLLSPYTYLRGGSQQHRRSGRSTSWSGWLHLFIFSIQWGSISSVLDVMLGGGVCTSTLLPKTTFWLRKVDCYHFSNWGLAMSKCPCECCQVLWIVVQSNYCQVVGQEAKAAQVDSPSLWSGPRSECFSILCAY